jgi:hypothetical protein
MVSSTGYGSAASNFIQQIRQINSPAADDLEQIQALLGDHTAYLAAFALIILKASQDKYRRDVTFNDLYGFTAYQELQKNAEAVRLYKEAAQHFLPRIVDTDEDTKPGRPVSFTPSKQ